MGARIAHPTLLHTFLIKALRGAGRYSRKDLKIRGIYLPYIGFFDVLGLFVWALKPYHSPAAFIRGYLAIPRAVSGHLFI
jgi:hypothetical protein